MFWWVGCGLGWSCCDLCGVLLFCSALAGLVGFGPWLCSCFVVSCVVWAGLVVSCVAFWWFCCFGGSCALLCHVLAGLGWFGLCLFFCCLLCFGGGVVGL